VVRIFERLPAGLQAFELPAFESQAAGLQTFARLEFGMQCLMFELAVASRLWAWQTKSVTGPPAAALQVATTAPSRKPHTGSSTEARLFFVE